MPDKTYIAIDLKSFYASVECRDRGLDPMTANLVVADATRTEKTICLAVSPSLKAYGIPGRARLFEVVQKVQEVNARRRRRAPDHTFRGKTSDDTLLKADASLALDYIIAPPRMAHYVTVSTQIYQIYLRYVAPEDIHVYSIDEVFIDATAYLRTYGLTAREFAMKLIREVLQTTGITATAGIGPNLYLCKIAMDIEAKHIPPDKDGVRIALLDEKSYRQKLWDHRPLTDFWRIGRGYAKKLEATGEFDNCYHAAAYYYLPLRDFTGFFRVSQVGLMQEASNPDAWNSITNLYTQAAQQLEPEELEEFLPGIADFAAKLEDFNRSGRLEQIVLKEENQAFLDIAVSLTESGADGETAYGILNALLGE